MRSSDASGADGNSLFGVYARVIMVVLVILVVLVVLVVLAVLLVLVVLVVPVGLVGLVDGNIDYVEICVCSGGGCGVVTVLWQWQL